MVLCSSSPNDTHHPRPKPSLWLRDTLRLLWSLYWLLAKSKQESPLVYLPPSTLSPFLATSLCPSWAKALFERVVCTVCLSFHKHHLLRKATWLLLPVPLRLSLQVTTNLLLAQPSRHSKSWACLPSPQQLTSCPVAGDVMAGSGGTHERDI